MILIQKSLKRVLVLSCRNKWTHFFKVGRMMISVKLMWKSQKQHWQYVQSNWSLGFCRNNHTILDKELTSASKKRLHSCYCIQKQMCNSFYESDYIISNYSVNRAPIYSYFLRVELSNQFSQNKHRPIKKKYCCNSIFLLLILSVNYF